MAKRLEWTDAARANLRRIDREAAMRILEGLARFLFTEEGDVKLLKGPDPREYRLRVGDYRVRMERMHSNGRNPFSRRSCEQTAAFRSAFFMET
jgi:mRNA-degrading endonuclease RelE of RelBE toxin-antitoxin system